MDDHEKQQYKDNLESMLKVLLKARKSLLNIYREDYCFADRYVKDTFNPGTEEFEKWKDFYSNNNIKEVSSKNLALPFIYGLESILIPIGFFSGLIRENKSFMDISGQLLSKFSYSSVADNNLVSTMVDNFDDCYSKIIKQSDYNDFTAAPYDEFWNYDAMIWAFGASVDVLDYLKAKNNDTEDSLKIQEKKITSYYSAARSFLDTLVNSELGVSFQSTYYTKRIGWYHSPKIKEVLRNKTGERFETEEQIEEAFEKSFKNESDVKEVLALFSRAVLVSYDIAADTFAKDSQPIRNVLGTLKTVLKSKNGVADFVKEQVISVCNEKDGFFKNKNNSHYLVQLFGEYTACLSRDLLKLDEIKNVLSKFVQRVVDGVVELLESKDIEWDQGHFYRCWKDIPEKGKSLSAENVHNFEYLAILPVLIRALANLLIVIKVNYAQFWKEEFIDEVIVYDRCLFKLVNILQDKFYLSKDGDIRNLWAYKKQSGQGEDRKFELAYTAPCVEALTLYAGYLLHRCADFELVTKSAEDLTTVSSEAVSAVQSDPTYRAFIEFKENLFGEIEKVVESKVNDLYVQEKLSLLIDKKINEQKSRLAKEITNEAILQCKLPLESHLGDNVEQLIRFLVSFFENLEDAERLTQVKSGDNKKSSIEKLRQLIWISQRVAEIKKNLKGKEQENKIDDLINAFTSLLFNDKGWDGSANAYIIAQRYDLELSKLVKELTDNEDR